MIRQEPILPDLLQPNLKLVFCGTAPSHRSAEKKAYYAYPGNRFWQTLHEIGLTPSQLAPKDFEKLLDYRIGLTDLVKYAKGGDSELRSGDYDIQGFRAKIEQNQPLIVAFTSKQAGKTFLGRPVDYGRQEEKIDQTILIVLPSTSGRGRGYWRIDPWKELSQLVQKLNQKI